MESLELLRRLGDEHLRTMETNQRYTRPVEGERQMSRSLGSIKGMWVGRP
jgi:hypothetical protein